MARSLWLQLLALGFVTGSQASSLVKRQFQTDAVCDTSFSWAQNHLQQSPCLVAAYLNGACGTNTYLVRKLTDNNRYDPPLGANATPCSCSWASYNLLSACTACQGRPQSIPTWSGWILGCNDFLEDEMIAIFLKTLLWRLGQPFLPGRQLIHMNGRIHNSMSTWRGRWPKKEISYQNPPMANRRQWAPLLGA
ncbi:hypothetical protein BDN71DRAFT_200431 [Pleurotus eryngii]|uniref:Uncharacterized protein n=1 Tax=Pleurotus eryngii TaxID=5323 RepID=A0A9P6DC25_PLEER|nr:hypothetical protein BDN71DRAFT_200431 [Pleurotus eryngii]